jgi:hypothetical protein
MKTSVMRKNIKNPPVDFHPEPEHDIRKKRRFRQAGRMARAPSTSLLRQEDGNA